MSITITLDGSLAEWSPATRLDTPGNGALGYALYGSYQGDAFVLAIQAPAGVAIGANTTLWFNTDLNTATGHQIWGWAGGAEYNINFGPDGRPALYTGADGQTLVSDALQYAFSADGTVLEIALPSALIGGARRAELYADVNNSVFLPSQYALGGYRIGENSAPSITLTPVVSTLAENANTTSSIKVADIVVSDDGIGVNTLSLSGANADLFAIVDSASGGKELHLKAGAVLDYETAASLAVTVAVDDPTVGSTPDASVAFTLSVTDVPETIGAITLDGALGDWTAAARLDTPSNGAPGYALYGSYQGDAFVLAIQAPAGVAIGANTTLWFNTDLNTATGYQIFGLPNIGGAEYNIDLGLDGRPALYTGGEIGGRTLVSDALQYAFSADGTVIEIALPSALVGDARRADLLVDVNNATFLPGDYAGGGYRIGEKPPPLPQDPSLKIAIVYSETSADAFYNKTNYGQLFMAAQNQAYQAGIPFDVLSENDLTDIAKLVGYDAIVFPGLSHVKAANLAAITEALTAASKDYGIGLIAAGNFLTNDETGAAFAGDSYIRMKNLLGVTLDGFGSTSGIVLKATNTTHPVSDLYAPAEVVGQYSNISYLNFRDVSGAGQTLFSQQVAGGDVSAVIATTTGGRNVHFASDAILGNNNILAEAINWSARGDAPDVGLQMTRGNSLFFSRNDMDQSQESFDNPEIYAAMNPIVEQWYRDYGFVGSYYINVGNNPPDQTTDWAISRPYYQQLLALESEIGTHSYTHPHDTNILSAAQIQFEFEQSKQVIAQQLGIPVVGAAVPGAPENLQTSLAIIQYFDYLTGGYSATGAGYPGAFGFLTPDLASKVYFAPNMSFDFSLIGFRGLTPAQAEAVWAQEYAAIMNKATTPIIHWPWHDYGPTQWNLGDGPSGYTLEMFTNFIQRAYADGAEFVTGADLAQRIESFVASDITIRQDGDKIVATATGSDLGKFALDVATSQQIASVDNWYAFDGTKVFLPKNGGTFAIALGSGPADVTRIAELPMRAELLSASGDGTELEFALNGRGAVKVDLKAWGANSVVASGADGGSLAGEMLTLSLANLGAHTVKIDYVGASLVAGTAGNDVIVAANEGRTIDGGGGDDHLIGGDGADTFVYRLGGGADTVQGFDAAADKIQLIGTSFASAQDALAQFFQDAAGATLSFSATDTLVLANTTLNQLQAEHIILGDTLVA